MDRYEDFERSLDPHRADEQAAVAAEVAARLRDRGVAVTGAERPEDLADLLAAVERFEAAVEGHGGDLMVGDLRGPEPDDAHFVGPRRDHGEAGRAFNGRIDDAPAPLRGPPRHTHRHRKGVLAGMTLPSRGGGG